jgi:PAS domain-containing protein
MNGTPDLPSQHDRFAGLDMLASAVLVADADGLVRYANPAAEHLLDISAKALSRQKLVALFTNGEELGALCEQAIGLLDDHLRVFAQRTQVHVRQFEFQHLCRAADAPERVLDLVREVADQFLVGLALVEEALFAIELELLDVLAQLDDDLGLAGRADDAVHVQRVASRTEQRQVLAQVGIFMGDRLFAQRAQLVAIDEQADQLLARQRLG